MSGALRRLPVSGALFLAGFLAITGSPPFGPFISEFTILTRRDRRRRHSSRPPSSSSSSLVIFVGMGSTVLAVVHGPISPRPAGRPRYRDGFWKTAPILAALR